MHEGKGAGMGLLEDKVAVVTGATSGLGARMAEWFVAAGARVVVIGARGVLGAHLLGRLSLDHRTVATSVSDGWRS